MALDIIIVNHNSGGYLKNCLEAVSLSLGFKDYRVIIFDNGSTDESVRYAKRFYPELEYFENNKNIGFAPAINRVLRKTDGEFVLLLNPDVIILPQTIERLMEFIKNRPRCAVVGAEIVSPEGYFQPSCRRFPNYLNIIGGRRSFIRRIFPNNLLSQHYLCLNLDYTKPQQVDFLEGSLMALRRKALADVGYFDEKFFLYLEDADLCYRLKQQGWEIWWLPKTYGVHFRGERFRIDNIHPLLHHNYGFYNFVLKHYRPGLILNLFLKVLLILRLIYVLSTESLKRHIR